MGEDETRLAGEDAGTGFAARHLGAFVDLLRELRELASPGDWPPVVIRRLVEAVGADFGAIAEIQEETRTLGQVYAHGFPSASAPPGTELRGRGVIGRVLRGEVVRTPDVQEEPGYEGIPPWHPRIGPCLGIPQRAFGKIFGVALLGRSPGASPFSEAEEEVAATMSFYAAIALDGMRRLSFIAHERAFTSAVLDALEALVVVLDAEGRIVRFNKACERATGYKEEEVRGARLFELLLIPEEAPAVRAVFAALAGGEMGNRFENHWVARDGRRRLISWSNGIIRDPQGRVRFVIGTGLDITEKREAERGLRDSLKFQELVLATVATPVFVVDTERTITSVNRAFSEVTGLEAEEVVGKRCDVLGCDACGPSCSLLEGRRLESVWKKECAIRGSGGRRLSIVKNAMVFRDERGAVRGAVESFVDVTEIVATREAEKAERQRVEAALREVSEAKRRLDSLLSFAAARERRVVGLKAEVNRILAASGSPEKYRAPSEVRAFLDRPADGPAGGPPDPGSEPET